MNDYSKLSAEELRELLLAHNLSHEFMAEEDYTTLLDNESEFDAPRKEVIDFCFDGLSVMPKYDDISVRDFDVKELIKTRANKTSIPKYRKLKKTALIIAAVIASMIVAQFTASAMGFDLFGYVFNWNKPEVVQIINGESINVNDGADIEVQYPAIDKIPLEIKTLIPDYIFDNFEFQQANYIKQTDNEINTFFFLDEKDNLLIIQFVAFGDGVESHIEKDESGHYEEYVIGGNMFKVFTNTENCQAIWVYGDYVYSLRANFDDIQSFKHILNSLY